MSPLTVPPTKSPSSPLPAAAWLPLPSPALPRLPLPALLLPLPLPLLLLLTVLAFNLVGDGLRDAFDPKMKR